jgi:NADPH-dependent curcumin reductase CurA
MTIPKTHRRVVLVRGPAANRPPNPTSGSSKCRCPNPRHGQVLLRKVHYLSLDPYMRGRMRDAGRSYAAAGRRSAK